MALGAVTTFPQDDTAATPANDGGTVHLAALPHPHPLRESSYDITPLEDEFGWVPRPLKEAVADYMGWLKLHPPAGPSPSL